MLDAHTQAVIIEIWIILGGIGLAGLLGAAVLAVLYVVPGQPKR